MFIFCFTLCCLVSLAFGALLNVGIENVPDQIVINANQLTPFTYKLLKILENLMGNVPKRHSSINFHIIPAVDIPLVEMVYSGRLNVHKILGEIAENFEQSADLAQIFEHFLMFADGYYQPAQTAGDEHN
ncbi:hypothetical protein niasHT_002700 [Heterodera trifolii]|uniref:Uncharacterized protein n=1 Tax=Heterodera trifolii TaxID=157864 RepID=A0ABD2LSZ2_9BILA